MNNQFLYIYLCNYSQLLQRELQKDLWNGELGIYHIQRMYIQLQLNRMVL